MTFGVVGELEGCHLGCDYRYADMVWVGLYADMVCVGIYV